MDKSAITDHAPQLRKMLETVVERRKTRQGEPAELCIITPAQLGEPLPRWQARMQAAETDGATQSLHASIREEGWRAFATGGLKAMHALADRACSNNNYLISILDHRWDGIGTPEHGVWTA
jgi:hypothetical protein